MKAILNSSNREYLIINSIDTGTREDNEQKRINGECYHAVYNTIIYYCRILKNDKPFGKIHLFTKEQITIL
jgi:hypothetical protein